jgi:hypothetical protein
MRMKYKLTFEIFLGCATLLFALLLLHLSFVCEANGDVLVAFIAKVEAFLLAFIASLVIYLTIRP